MTSGRKLPSVPLKGVRIGGSTRKTGGRTNDLRTPLIKEDEEGFFISPLQEGLTEAQIKRAWRKGQE